MATPVHPLGRRVAIVVLVALFVIFFVNILTGGNPGSYLLGVIAAAVAFLLTAPKVVEVERPRHSDPLGSNSRR